ncbi:hypothetical protein ES703_98854 [subsurface metagenome]
MFVQRTPSFVKLLYSHSSPVYPAHPAPQKSSSSYLSFSGKTNGGPFSVRFKIINGEIKPPRIIARITTPLFFTCSSFLGKLSLVMDFLVASLNFFNPSKLPFLLFMDFFSFFRFDTYFSIENNPRLIQKMKVRIKTIIKLIKFPNEMVPRKKAI